MPEKYTFGHKNDQICIFYNSLYHTGHGLLGNLNSWSLREFAYKRRMVVVNPIT